MFFSRAIASFLFFFQDRSRRFLFIKTAVSVSIICIL